MTATPISDQTIQGERLDRIRSMRYVRAMVALDSIDVITERVRNLLSHGRRITTVRRYVRWDNTVQVTVGLTFEGDMRTWRQVNSAGMSVLLRPGWLPQFGFSAHSADSATEAEVWRRYYDADGCEDKLRDMTQVRITGGLAGDGPAGDDELVIRHWTANSACVEIVVGFDCGTGPVAEAARLAEERG